MKLLHLKAISFPRRSLRGYVVVLLSIFLTASAFPTTTRAWPAGDASSVADIALAQFARGLERPLLVTHAGDGSGRLFVVEQFGRIRVVHPDGIVETEPYLDLSDRVAVGVEAGLLGLAFHPDFSSNGRLFLTYTRIPDGRAVVSEFMDVEGSVDPNRERTLLVLPQRMPENPQHNTGTLAFDEHGMLLIGTGDGGGVGGEASQDLGSLFGKILRIDVDTSQPYGIPPGNGFEGRPGALPEIHAIGFRNPWRFSVDPATGNVYIGDVGSIFWEEINLLRKDAVAPDFGWNVHEGPQCSHWQPFCDVTTAIAPVLAYPHRPGSAVVGGHVYRGATIPGLAGTYLFGDWTSGIIWGAASEDLVSASAQPVQLASIDGGLTSFGEDESGELYVVDGARGHVLKIIQADTISPPSPIPQPSRSQATVIGSAGGGSTWMVNVRSAG